MIFLVLKARTQDMLALGEIDHSTFRVDRILSISSFEFWHCSMKLMLLIYYLKRFLPINGLALKYVD